MKKLKEEFVKEISTIDYADSIIGCTCYIASSILGYVVIHEIPIPSGNRIYWYIGWTVFTTLLCSMFIAAFINNTRAVIGVKAGSLPRTIGPASRTTRSASRPAHTAPRAAHTSATDCSGGMSTNKLSLNNNLRGPQNVAYKGFHDAER